MGQQLAAPGWAGRSEQDRVQHIERNNPVDTLGSRGPSRIVAKPKVPTKPHHPWVVTDGHWPPEHLPPMRLRRALTWEMQES